jgi:hypothetical protein
MMIPSGVAACAGAMFANAIGTTNSSMARPATNVLVLCSFISSVGLLEIIKR